MDSYRMKRDAEENLLNKIVSALAGGGGMESRSSKKSMKNFCVEDTLAPADIEVTVTGVGKLSFPLNKTDVQKLIKVSTTAKFGMGEKTVEDKNVRNTQMIESKKLDVTINQESLSRITGNMRKALNLPANSNLMPHLYNMLIYEPGQFFKQHRDSEKLPNMVATLVIVLPSPHVGGDLIIEHGKKKHTFSTESVDEENANCICFYSDCLHKVNKVKSGYRVALTFNVVLEADGIADTADTNEELKAAVRGYFDNAIVKNRSKKIVFFLNHTYSKHGLGWKLLKGEDCQFASSFRSVARELDLDIHLALGEIHQNWASSSEYRPKPDWLVETDSTLNNWIDANNIKLPYGEYSTTRSEILFTRETHYDNFDPTKEDFSGPTGNEGSTVDYWYKRAAIVLWQKSDSPMIKFELNYDKGMSELRTLVTSPGNEKKVREILDKASELLHKGEPERDNFETFVNIALYVNKKKEAQNILSSFRPDVLISKNALFLTQLQQCYGIEWLIELIGAVVQRKTYGYSWQSSMASEAIVPFVREFVNCGGDRSVMEFLLNGEVTTFIDKKYYSGSSLDLERPRVLFEVCSVIGNVSLQEKLAQYLTSHPDLFSKKELVKLYRLLQKNLSPESSENFECFRARLETGIQQELSSETRNADDWSILTVLSCNCEHCNILTNFLRSCTEKIKSWPANGSVRKHITSILKRSKAPVDVTEQCETKPFTMVLTKNATIHTEAAGKCNELIKMLKAVKPKTVAKKRQSPEKKVDKKRKNL